MGYAIKIGNAVIAACDPEDYDGELRAEFHVEDVVLDEAPADGSPTDYSNRRWPSYSGWSDFCDSTGLTYLFLSKECGLMREHPGCFLIKPEHLETVKEAEPLATGYNRGRWEWLVYWMDWALKNCETPAIENS